MKKLLLSVIAFALITTSCNKYKDDFKALNDRLDALAAQVQGVATLAAGITTIQTQLTSLATAVAAIQTNTAAIAALTTNLAALTTTVNTINTNLNALATAVATGNTTTQGLINALTTQIGLNQTATIALINSVNTALSGAIAGAVTSINGATATAIANAQAALAQAIADAQTNINAATAQAVADAQAALTTLINNAFGNTDAAIAALSLQLTNAVATLNQSILDAVTAVNNNSNSNQAILVSLIAQLQLALDIANAQLNTLVNSNNIFVGDLVINDEATLAFAESLGAKVRAITGNVTIDASIFDAGQMTRLKNVTNNTLALPPPQQNPFIQTIVGNLIVSGTQAVDLSKLLTVSGDGVTTGNVTVSGSAHNLSALLSVKDNYTVLVNVMDDALLSVGGDLTLNYGAAYSYPNLTTVLGNIITTDNIFVSAVLFPALTSVGMIDGNTPVWASAGTVNLRTGNLSSLTANSAGTIILGEPSYPGAFTLTGNSATTLTMGANSVAGALTINIGAAVGGVNPVTVVDLLTLTATAGAISITTDLSTNSTVNMPSYNDSDDITINGPRTQTLQAYTGAVAGLLNSTTIFTLTVPVYRATNNVGTQFDGLTVLSSLTIGDVRASITTASFFGDAAATLTNLVATSSVYAVNITLASMANLLTVTTAGLLQRLDLNTNTLMHTVSTSGNMDYLILNNNDALTTVSVGHNYVASVLGQGTNITLFDNDALTTFSSGTITGRLKSLSITENNVLSALSFPNFVTGDNITAGVVSMSIFNNKLSGSYTQSIFAINSAPVIVQSGLSSIKAYALNVLASAPHAGSFINFSFFAGAPGGGGPWDNTIATLDADALAFSIASGDANPGPNSFVQRLLDNNGQGGSQELGSRINVARELGYVQ